MINPPLDSPSESRILEKQTQAQVCIRAERLLKSLSLAEVEREDLQQEMYIELFKAEKRFDPQRTQWGTFASRVLDKFCQNYLRQKFYLLRKQHFELFFSDIAEKHSPEDPWNASSPLERFIQKEMLGQLHDFIGTLPQELQEVCQVLFSDTRKQKMESLGISKTSFYRRLQKLRHRFESAVEEKKLPDGGTLFEFLQK